MPSNDPPGPLGPELRGNFIDFLQNAAEAGLRDAIDYARDYPAFLADNSPRTVPFAFGQGVARLACRQWARGEGIPSTPAFDGFWGGVCEPYLDSIGEFPGDGLLEPPFVGGQCPVQYRIDYSFTRQDGLSFTESFQPFSGPIVPEVWGAPAPGDEVSVENCNNVGGTFRRWTIRSASNPAQGLGLIAGCNATLDSFSVTRLDGQPDNCGSTDPFYDPPNIPTGLPPVTPVPIRIPGIGPVDVGVSFNPDGSINVSLPDLGIDLTIPNPLAGDDDDDDDATPGDQGQPGSPDTVGSGDAAEGEDPNRILRGVVVEVLTTPPRANMLFNESESYMKGAYFVYTGGDAGLSLNDTAAITRPVQFYPAVENANRYRVVPNVGFTIRVTPYWEED